MGEDRAQQGPLRSPSSCRLTYQQTVVRVRLVVHQVDLQRVVHHVDKIRD